MGILTDNNVVRMIVFADETDPRFSRRPCEYGKIAPIIIDPSYDDDTEVLDESYFLSHNDDGDALMMVKITSQAFVNNDGVWGVYYCGYEPTELQIYDFIEKLESSEVIDEKVLVDITEPYCCTVDGFSLKLQMSNAEFDKIIDSLESHQLVN